MFTGSGFTGATGLTGALETGVTVVPGSFSVTNDTQAQAQLSIAPTAAAATLNIGVATPNGNSNTVGFTVN
jgi:hypothetical protein